MTEPLLRVNAQVSIARSELLYRATRAGGPGGQHVNTSSTRIELLWDFEHSAAVDDLARTRIRAALAGRIDSDGMIRVVASDRRSQLQNRAAAEERLVSLVRGALAVRKARRRTAPSRAAREERLTEKKRQGEKKRGRRPEYPD